MEPRPFKKPTAPVWCGANGSSALRRAARLGDGFFGAGSAPTARFAEQVLVVRQALAELGRPVSDFPIAKRAYIAVDDNGARARDRINAGLERLYGHRSPDIEAAAIAGTAAECPRQVAKVAAAWA